MPSVVEVGGEVIRNMSRSLLFISYSTAREVFVPKSLVASWWFNRPAGNVGGCLELDDLEKGDSVTLVIPSWLAHKEELL